MPARRLIGFVVLGLFASHVYACMWDYDTLRDEKRGMPGIAEVLAGQWERHSQFFYQSRVQQMKTLLATHPNDEDAINNLAVAYFKLGDSPNAIATMHDKDARFPGRYTTYSNLGTFYMLRGDLDGAITNLKHALAINPDAHFGREEYQLDLAEYLLRAQKHPYMLDRSFVSAIYNPPPTTTGASTQPEDVEEVMNELFDHSRNYGNPSRFANLGFKSNIIEGVVGMLRFGTDQSPDLYFALGDLLALRGDKNLAVRAYQRALDLNYSHSDAIRKVIENVEEAQVPRGGLDPGVIAAERVDAGKWVADYQRFEDDLVRAGKDTQDESNYAAFYASHGRSLKTNDIFIGDYTSKSLLEQFPIATPIVIVVFSTTCVLVVSFVLRRLKGKLKR